MNLQEYKGVFIYAQQVDNKIDSIALELLGKANDLAADLGTDVTAVLIGSDVKGLVDELAEYGADRVIVVDDPALKEYRTEPYTHALASVINESFWLAQQQSDVTWALVYPLVSLPVLPLTVPFLRLVSSRLVEMKSHVRDSYL